MAGFWRETSTLSFHQAPGQALPAPRNLLIPVAWTELTVLKGLCTYFWMTHTIACSYALWFEQPLFTSLSSLPKSMLGGNIHSLPLADTERVLIRWKSLTFSHVPPSICSSQNSIFIVANSHSTWQRSILPRACGSVWDWDALWGSGGRDSNLFPQGISAHTHTIMPSLAVGNLHIPRSLLQWNVVFLDCFPGSFIGQKKI